jgi:6-phosphofructokinase 2
MTFAAGDPAVALILTLTMSPALDIATTTDTVVPTEKLRCSEPRYDPGGGGINVARAVHLLGGEAMAIFPAGGMSGAMLCDLLKGEGVPHTSCRLPDCFALLAMTAQCDVTNF